MTGFRRCRQGGDESASYEQKFNAVVQDRIRRGEDLTPEAKKAAREALHRALPHHHELSDNALGMKTPSIDERGEIWIPR